MRYVFGLVVGLLAGSCFALMLIYFNPLTIGQTIPINDGNWSFDYSLDPERNWIMTHDRKLPLGVAPADVALLWEAGIRNSMLTVLPLSDDDRQAAASRISVPSDETEFLRAGLRVDDYWLISVPGQGSVVMYSRNNFWPLVRDTIVGVGWLRREYDRSIYGPTRGPDRSGARVIGLSGSYRNLLGRARERIALDSYFEVPDLLGIEGQLQIEFDDALD